MKIRFLELDERTEALSDLMKANPEQSRELEAKLEVSLLYHENALEGVVYSGSELMSALDPTAEPADASQVPVFTDIRNHKAALDFIKAEARSKRSKISLTMIKKVYEILGAGMEGREKAVYRKDMPLHRTYFHEIAQPSKIPGLLEKLVDFASSAECREMHPLNQAATVQWQFMQAFPFSENSGKVARLLSAYLLVRRDLMPVIVHAVDRQRYYEALRLPVASLRQLLLEAAENSLDNAFKFFNAQVPVRVRASGE